MRLTIDTGAIAHRIRRWLFKFFGTPQTMGRCYDCGKPLTFDECRYYHTACERCEGINFHAQQDAAGVPAAPASAKSQQQERARQLAEDWHEGVPKDKQQEWANRAAGLLLHFADGVSASRAEKERPRDADGSSLTP